MSDGVLGLVFGCRGESEFRVLVTAFQQHHVADPKTPFRQRAGLVEHDSIEIARPFERGSVADQKAIAGAERCADGDHERNGKA